MKFVMPRDRTIASIFGHAIEFKKDVPTYVPKEMWSIVQEKGGVPVEELPEEVKAPSSEPQDAAERKAKIFEGFEKMALRNIREEFNAGGAPHVGSLREEIGFVIGAKERDLLWQEFKVKDKAE